MTNIYFEVNEESINKIFYKGLKNELIDKYKDGYNNGYSDALEQKIGEQKIGHWIDGENTKWKCSECGYEVLDWNTTPYCPNCGAKMQEAEE